MPHYELISHSKEREASTQGKPTMWHSTLWLACHCKSQAKLTTAVLLLPEGKRLLHQATACMVIFLSNKAIFDPGGKIRHTEYKIDISEHKCFSRIKGKLPSHKIVLKFPTQIYNCKIKILKSLQTFVNYVFVLLKLCLLWNTQTTSANICVASIRYLINCT